MPSLVIIFLPLPKSLRSGNTKAKNEKINHSEHYHLTVKNIKWSRDTFKRIKAMFFPLRYGKDKYHTICYTVWLLDSVNV